MAAVPIPEHAQSLLFEPNPAVIATIDSSGAPITVATWYLWEDGRALINMDARRHRLKYLRRDPRVSLTVLDGSDWHRHVTLHGRVTGLEDDPDLVDIDRLAQHYTGQPYPERTWPRISGWIDVESWHSWNVV